MSKNKHPLRQWRDSMGWNLDDVSKLFGVARSTICRWEKHRREPSLSQAALLSEKTGIPLDQFVRQREAAE